jgi:PEP-CTERM motif-containing protein
VMRKLLLPLVFAACAQAGSTWEYTFTDTFCTACGTVGFSFSQSEPVSIPQGGIFLLPGDRLSTCRIQNPDLYCQQINMYWRSDGLLEVNLFFGSSSYPTDWQLPDEAQFAVPGALDVEGVWTNSFSVEPWGIDTQTFSIVDPPESVPEPSAGHLALSGLGALLCLLGFSRANLRESLRRSKEIAFAEARPYPRRPEVS